MSATDTPAVASAAHIPAAVDTATNRAGDGSALVGRYGPVAALVGMIGVFALAQGLTYPLLSLRLEAAGFGADSIGLSGAMTPLGFMLAAPFAPRLAKSLGTVRALLALVAGTVAALGLLAVSADFTLWLGLRFALGAAVAGLYVIGESGLHKITPNAIRGRVMGVYNTVMLLGYAAGPALLAALGSQGVAPFLAGMALMAAAAVPVMVFAARLPRLGEDGKAAGPREALRFARLAPALLLACAAVAFFDHASTALLPLFAIAQGLGEASAMQLATAALIGAMLGQLAIGALADRVGGGLLVVACATVVVAACAALPQAMEGVLVWPLVLVLGAAAFGPFTVALTELGRRFTGNLLVAGNVAVGIAWGLGQSGGSHAAGLAMDAVGPQGFTLVLGGLFALLGLAYAARSLRRGPAATARPALEAAVA